MGLVPIVKCGTMGQGEPCRGANQVILRGINETLE